MDIHNPLKQRNPFARFFVLLFSPIQVSQYIREGEDVCYHCLTPILVPWFYHSFLLKIIYFLIGAAIGYVTFSLRNVIFYISLPLCLLFHHVFSAAILAFGRWEPFNPEESGIVVIHKAARKHLFGILGSMVTAYEITFLGFLFFS